MQFGLKKISCKAIGERKRSPYLIHQLAQALRSDQHHRVHFSSLEDGLVVAYAGHFQLSPKLEDHVGEKQLQQFKHEFII